MDANNLNNKLVNDTVDKDLYDKKCAIALKFLNRILSNIGKPEINKLEEFIDIDRKDIIKDENKQIINDMENDILIVFDKKKIDYYRKTYIKNYILTLIRKMIDEVGYDFNYIKKKQQTDNQVINLHKYSINKKNI